MSTVLERIFFLYFLRSHIIGHFSLCVYSHTSCADRRETRARQHLSYNKSAHTAALRIHNCYIVDRSVMRDSDIDYNDLLYDLLKRFYL